MVQEERGCANVRKAAADRTQFGMKEMLPLRGAAQRAA